MARITPAGLELLKKMDKPVEEFHHNVLGRLGDPHLRSLLLLLDEAREAAA
jgi:hypothetical protein